MERVTLAENVVRGTRRGGDEDSAHDDCDDDEEGVSLMGRPALKSDPREVHTCLSGSLVRSILFLCPFLPFLLLSLSRSCLRNSCLY